ncbi:hypothetical protein [Aquimarina sp. 2304DJ70-9]|uniref:hypothetical protein n=1 Tax=Aquimarina penaris TaxID=3231044 RepID=UPI0034620A68
MKNLILTLFFLASIHLSAQTDGISYQAVIIGPDNQELPGVDAEGNILPNATVSIRFTIIDSNNGMEYQEVQTTNTDQYGRINLTIGSINPDEFTKINWDGTSKDLKVEIDFSGGSSFVDMSREKLTFLPYGFHRDIKATGKLVVDDVTDLNSELTVGGPTRLNSTLDVNNNNATNLTGELNVDGSTGLNSTLDVQGVTDLNDELNVNNNATSNFSGDLNVAAEGTAKFDGDAVFNGESKFKDLSVDGPANLNGKVNINTNVDAEGGQNNIGAYPLLIQGSSQGVAIKVNGSRSKDNNYISFWDEDSGEMWGRIQGESSEDLLSNPNYVRQVARNGVSLAVSAGNLTLAVANVFQKGLKTVAASTSATGCVGFGACVTVPIPSLIVEGGTDLVTKIAGAVLRGVNLGLVIEENANFIVTSNNNVGVTYSSGAGDYAEWLPKQNPSDVFTPGELVGVNNGFVTKNLWGAEKVMIVSTRPIVLGNMPQKGNEKDNVKIAFMGQVPARVIGSVNPGDYILPSEIGSGFAKAVNSKDMTTRDYKKIAGVAWLVINKISNDVSLVNVAVGINTNDLSEIVYKQEEELKALRSEYRELKNEVAASNKALINLVPGFAKAIEVNEPNMSESESDEEYQNQKQSDYNLVRSHEDDILYFDLSKEHIETSIQIARENYKQQLDDNEQIDKMVFGNTNNFKSIRDVQNTALIPIEEHPFWQRMDSDPEYREEITQFMQSTIEKAMHTHQKHEQKFTDIKVRN